MLNAGRIGMMFKLRIKGYIDLNNPPSHPPSSGSPSNPTPIHNPIQSMGVQSPRLQMVDNCFIPATIHTTAPTPPPPTTIRFSQIRLEMNPLTLCCIPLIFFISPTSLLAPSFSVFLADHCGRESWDCGLYPAPKTQGRYWVL
jgi:hypothetical protein